MQSGFRRFQRYTAFLIAAVFVIGLCLSDADAQRRRKRRVRSAPRPVITNPDIAAPGSERSTGPDGERIISTADENPAEGVQNPEITPAKKPRTTTSQTQDMQQTINALSNQVNRLNEKLGQMQENDRSQLDLNGSPARSSVPRACGLSSSMSRVSWPICNQNLRGLSMA